MQAPINLEGITPMAPSAPPPPPESSSTPPDVGGVQIGAIPIPIPPAAGAAGAATGAGTEYSSSSLPINEGQIQRLMEQGYTRGLAMSLNDSKKCFSKRIWIVDNSGSMQHIDGNKIVATGKQANQMKIVQCSRWEEIQSCVSYHVQIAAAIEAPTTFRLLNHPGAAIGSQQMTVCDSTTTTTTTPAAAYYADIVQQTQEALTWINKTRPGGCTPLTQHLLEIQFEISKHANELRSAGQRVAIIIATDGLPTDQAGYGGHSHQQQFVEALRTFEGLPVWVVVRLCCDEDAVINFYNELDNQLELSLEVLDDFTGEAYEIYSNNPWLNYGLPIQRMRELGYHDRVFDLLDERPLTKTELRDFCCILFGWENMDGVPDPSVDFDGFYLDMKRLVGLEKDTWNPITKRMEPWINLNKLSYMYGDRMKCFELCQIL